MFFQESITVTIKDERIQPVSRYVIFSLRSAKKNPLLSNGFSVKTTRTETGKIEEIILGKGTSSTEMAVGAIERFHSNYPTLVSASQVAVSRRKIFKIAHSQPGSCVAQECAETVYQMLSDDCNDVKTPTISGVELVCSASLGLCKINIIAT